MNPHDQSPDPGPDPSAAPRLRGGLLRHPDFRLLWGGEAVSDLGDATATVALPLVAVAVLHASALEVSALTAGTYVPYLVLGLPAGALVDRCPHRRLMMICDLLQLLLFASLPVARALGVLSVAQLLAVAVLAGTCAMLFSTAYSVYLTELIGVEDLLEGNAKLQGTSSVTRVIGPGLGGLLAQLLGPVTALLVDAGSFVVSAGSLSRIQGAASTPRPPRSTRLRGEIAEGIRLVLGDRFLRPQMLWAALINFGLAGYFALIVVFLSRSVELSAGLIGVVLTCGGLGGVLGAAAARRLGERFGTARTFVAVGALTTPCGLLSVLAGSGPRLAFAFVGVFCLEGGLVLGTVLLSAFEQAYVPAGALGRVKTSMRMVSYGIAPIAALIAGVLADALGPRSALAIMLAVGASSAILLLSGPMRGRRDLPVAPSSVV